ncbi:hypothetical protein H2248_010278 [Termitomyces sp. 'cryptogamus']|nr:hypothetical protein H2248_010278 [Termitomyces sp. 'cryptogamus']
MQEKHDRLAEEQRSKEEQAAQAQAHAAEVENELFQEDINQESTADHPPNIHVAPFKPQSRQHPKTSESTSDEPHMFNDSDMDQDGEYVPPPAPQDKNRNEEEDKDLEIEDQQSN